MIHVMGGLTFRQMQQATRRIKATVSKCAMAPLARALFQSPYLPLTTTVSHSHGLSSSMMGMSSSRTINSNNNHNSNSNNNNTNTSRPKAHGKVVDSGLSRALIRDLLDGHRFSESSSAM